MTPDSSSDRGLGPFAARLDELTAITARAASRILAIDPSRAARRRKADRSFVTAADEGAQAALIDGLSRLFPDLPAVCEEATGAPRPTTLGRHFALIDPLDGTREFLELRSEFTVNLAIVADGAAGIGVIAAPALGLIWRGVVGRGAERLSFDPKRGEPCGDPTPIRSRRRPAEGMRVAVSRSHLDPDTAALLSRLPVHERVACGSSLKFCRVAEGGADLYPRLAPTFEWDVAAGNAVLAGAGGLVTRPDGTPLVYGQVADEFRVPAFLAFGDPAAVPRVIPPVRG